MGIDSVVKAGPVIPVLQFQSVDEGVKVCRALYEGGIRTFEITMRTPVALDVISAVAKDLGSDAIVGAGTLTRPEHFAQAKEAGAVFAVSPGITAALALAQADVGLDWLPGIATPSELITALEFGLTTPVRRRAFLPHGRHHAAELTRLPRAAQRGVRGRLVDGAQGQGRCRRLGRHHGARQGSGRAQAVINLSSLARPVSASSKTDRALHLFPILDDVLNGQHRQVVLIGKAHRVVTARHGAVGQHQFA